MLPLLWCRPGDAARAAQQHDLNLTVITPGLELVPGINAEYFSGTSYCPGLSRLRPGFGLQLLAVRSSLVTLAEGLAGVDGR